MKQNLIIAGIFASILAMSTLFATDAHADHWRHGGGAYYYHPGYGWAVPALIGGAIVYEATRPPVVIQQPPVIIQQPTPQSNCSPWTEIQNPDGTITRTRTCTQ